ncbi:hypothetical protein ABZZ20_10800 [Streptomyces sp. NPDC006430]|uniref:hypothetical protein n=1 Tax=Streptomyces sp. NPDC006430 TaxID=3154299 RepID=UPI00339EB12E
MDIDKRNCGDSGEGCLVGAVRIPVKIVALLVVLPVRVVWDLLVGCGRAVRRHVLGPLSVYVLQPVLGALGWVLTVLFGLLFVWPWVGLWRYVLAPVGRATYAWLLAPLGRFLYAYLLRPLGEVLARLGRGLLWLAGAVHRYVLTPVGHALAWTGAMVHRHLLRPLGLAVRWVACGVHRYLLAPLWQVVVWAWHVAGRSVRALWRAVRWVGWVLLGWPASQVYRYVLTPVGHVLRDVWRTVRVTVRDVRAELRRALFGGDASDRSGGRPPREPARSRARTLGSTTAAGNAPATPISASPRHQRQG